jgi:lysophospholipase L1-like esterase
VSMYTLKPHSVILFQGDSITDTGRSRLSFGPNTGDDLGFGYPRRITDRLLAENLDQYLQFYNRGISGDRIRDLENRWERDTLKLMPDLLSILIGVNDTWNYLYSGLGSSPEEYRNIFQGILEQTLQRLPDIQLVLCEPFILLTGEVNEEWEEDLVLRQDSVAELAKQFGAIHIPFQDSLNEAARQTSPHLLLDDGVHPTDKGHQVLADCWLKTVYG